MAQQSSIRWKSMAALVLAVVLLRTTTLIVGASGFQGDIDNYRELGENLRTAGVFGWGDSQDPSQTEPTRFRPPLYPLALAALVHQGTLPSVAVAALHLVLGVVTVLLTFVLASRLNLGRWSAVAALLVACDPILLNQSTQIMTETLATALATLGLVCLTFNRRSWMVGLAGIVVGLAVLCRPTFLPWLGLCAIGAFLQHSERPGRWVRVGSMLAGAGLVLAPWMIRNYHLTGRPHLTTSHGGYTLLLGNNPAFFDHLAEKGSDVAWDSSVLVQAWQRRAAIPDPKDPRWSNLESLAAEPVPPARHPRATEDEDDHFAYALARRYMLANPGPFVHACFVRVGRLWQWTPNRLSPRESLLRRTARYSVGIGYGVLSLLAILGLLTVGRGLAKSPWLWGVLLCVTFTAVHSLYWSNMRMRAPLVPFVSILATVGASRVADRWQRHKSIQDR